MKKLIIIFSFLLFINCGADTIVNDCFTSVNISGTINLSNPEFINLQVPLGFAFTSLAGRNLLLIRSTSDNFKAFDLECPERDCSDSMEYDGLKLICSCTGKEYNSLNASPIDGEGCFALEYNVVESSASTLQISN